MQVNKLPYFKLIDKAKKLLALAQKGIGGEGMNAKSFYEKFLSDYNITESEIENAMFKRTFRLLNPQHETLLSYVLMSINPFAIINRTANKYEITLDEEDYIEAENKIGYFYGLFKKEEQKLLKKILSTSANKEKDKSVFLTAFIGQHKTFLQPDEYALKKIRASERRTINPVINEKSTIKKRTKQEQEEDAKKAQEALNAQQQGFMMTQQDLERMKQYAKAFKTVNYVRANKSLN